MELDTEQEVISVFMNNFCLKHSNCCFYIYLKDLYCVYNLQSIVDKSFCDLSSDVPVLRESCNTEDCPGLRIF